MVLIPRPCSDMTCIEYRQEVPGHRLSLVYGMICQSFSLHEEFISIAILALPCSVQRRLRLCSSLRYHLGIRAWCCSFNLANRLVSLCSILFHSSPLCRRGWYKCNRTSVGWSNWRKRYRRFAIGNE